MSANQLALEEWRPVPSLSGRYEASSYGRVRSTALVRGGPKLLSQFTHPRGYRGVSITMNQKTRHIVVHKLVAEAFLGPRPIGKHINHIDFNTGNNAPSNLEYVTPKENVQHTVRAGRFVDGTRHPESRLTPEIVRLIRSKTIPVKEASCRFGVSKRTIVNVRTGKSWRWVQP